MALNKNNIYYKKSGLYFKKDKKVKIVTQYTTKNERGQSVTHYKYITDASLWAYAAQLSQEQTFEAKTYGNSETRFFVLNYRDDLNVYDFIEYRGKYYSITRVDTADDYKTDLYIYVKDAAKGNTPSNIEPAGD